MVNRKIEKLCKLNYFCCKKEARCIFGLFLTGKFCPHDFIKLSVVGKGLSDKKKVLLTYWPCVTSYHASVFLIQHFFFEIDLLLLNDITDSTNILTMVWANHYDALVKAEKIFLSQCIATIYCFILRILLCVRILISYLNLLAR